MKKEKIASIEEDDLFESSKEIDLTDIDANLICKLIVHCMSQVLQDVDGNPPTFSRSNNFLFFELVDKRFTIEVRDNNHYN